MLRLLIASAARTTFRSRLITQSNKTHSAVTSWLPLSQPPPPSGALAPPAGGPSEGGRSVGGPSDGHRAQGEKDDVAVLCGALGLFAFGYVVFSYIRYDQQRPEPCLTKFDPMPKIVKQGAEPDQSIKRSDPFEAGTVIFGVAPMVFQRGRGYYLIKSSVKLTLPWTKSITSDYKQICNDLALHGIHVDQSEAGARRGLTEYALKYMQKGVEEHLQKKCGHCSPVDASTAAINKTDFGREQDKRPTLLLNLSQHAAPGQSDVNGRVEFALEPTNIFERTNGELIVELRSTISLRITNGALTEDHYKTICAELKRHGIHTDQSKEGARRGLTELALKYMQKGVEEHLQKKC